MLRNMCRVAFVLFTVVLTTACGRSTRRDVTETRKVAVQPPREWVRIYIDAGHGGKDYGTRSLNKPIFYEKNLVLSTAFMLQAHLERLGYRTEMSRTTDVFIPLQGRVKEAHEHHADLFVSLHYNSAPNTQAHGVEVFFYKSKKDKDRAGDSARLAAEVLEGITRYTDQRSRGVKHGNFAVIRETDIPAILIEGGFLTNADEMARLKNPRYLNRIAWGIAEGIDEYLYGGQN